MNDLGVANQLHRDEVDRALNVVVLHRVGIALDRSDDQVADVADLGERRRYVLRMRNVEGDAAHVLAERGGDRPRALRVAPGYYNLATARGEGPSQLGADAGSPADDQARLNHSSCSQ